MKAQTTVGTAKSATVPRPSFNFRHPEPADGPAVHALIAACPPLDTNSLYANLLQTSHFANSCIVAEDADGICGWVSGYNLPDYPDTFFVWQVAVAERARGQNLGCQMIVSLLDTWRRRGARRLHTTVTADNVSSRRMFANVAHHFGAETREKVMFSRDRHLADTHDSEFLLDIGPLSDPRTTSNDH